MCMCVTGSKWHPFTKTPLRPTKTRACTQSGLSLSELAERCPDKHIRDAVCAMGWFCRRYKLDPRPEHSTETSVVYFATTLASDKPGGQRVAIKFMSEKAQYESEIECRKGLDTRLVL